MGKISIVLFREIFPSKVFEKESGEVNMLLVLLCRLPTSASSSTKVKFIL